MNEEVVEPAAAAVVDDTPPPEPQQAVSADEDAELDQLIADNTIDLPDGSDKLVPLSAVTTARQKLKEARTELKTAREGSQKQADLERQVQQLQGQIAQLRPYVEAYAQAQQQAQQPPQAEDTTELEEIARLYDFYKPDGALDLGRAKKARDREIQTAQQIAQQQVAPLAEMSVRDKSAFMLARAKNTVLPNGLKVDPAALDEVWRQLSPAITGTETGAIEAFRAALARSVMAMKPEQFSAMGKPQGQPTRGANGQFTAGQPLPPPMFTEPAGGRDPQGWMPLDDADRKAIKAMGITEKEFMEIAKGMPTGGSR